MNRMIRFSLFALLASLASLASLAQAQVTYVHTDLLGSTVIETDALGTVTRQVEHASFGLEVLGKVKSGPGFTGHYRDAETDLVYMQQRYYDPAAMRFISTDPVWVDTANGGNFNRYWYANNNPYTYVDPDGRYKEWFAKAFGYHEDYVRDSTPRQAIESSQLDPIQREAESVVEVARSVGDNVEVNATGNYAALVGMQMTKNLANGSDSVGAHFGQGMSAGVTAEVEVLRVDTGVENPLGVDVKLELGGGVGPGGLVSVKQHANGEMSLKVGLGIVLGQHTTAGASFEEDVNER